jgi:ATP-dependent exoDNAse (exonuclease V) alpha subunit
MIFSYQKFGLVLNSLIKSCYFVIVETFTGIVQHITYHNPENGWTVLKVNPITNHHDEKTVTVYQANVFAGATLEFEGEWQEHPKFGMQFKGIPSVRYQLILLA